MTMQVWGLGLQTSVPLIPEKLSGWCLWERGPVSSPQSGQGPRSRLHIQGSWSSGKTTRKVWCL